MCNDTLRVCSFVGVLSLTPTQILPFPHKNIQPHTENTPWYGTCSYVILLRADLHVREGQGEDVCALGGMAQQRKKKWADSAMAARAERLKGTIRYCWRHRFDPPPPFPILPQTTLSEYKA